IAGAGGEPRAAARHRLAARPHAGPERGGPGSPAPRSRARLALGIGRHRRVGGSARASPAPGRSAGDAGEARQKRFRGSIPDRYPCPQAMTGTVWDSVGEIPDDRSLREAIRQRVEAAGTSFYWAMRLLPGERRNGMYAIYAFCREVDDIADDFTPLAQKQAALAEWHAEIDALYAGNPRHLVARALHEPIERYGLRRQDFHAVIDGMEMDAAQDIRAPDLATLDLYCGRVAGAVGHLSVHVFGDATADAHAVADSLGRALQLTNILRDLDEDAQRGRLYLPRELLQRHGIASTDPP